MLLKKCCRCGDIKSISSFSQNNYNLDGLQNWCKDCCKKEYEKTCSKYVYIIKRYEEILYVGSCTNICMRISSHVNGHVTTTKDYMLAKEWTSIMYLDVSNHVADRQEREFLEYALIDLLSPRLNKIDREICLNNDSREVELSELAEDLIYLEQFKTYKTNKINKKERNEYMYYVDEDNIDEYASDISDFINEYIDDEEEEQ